MSVRHGQGAIGALFMIGLLVGACASPAPSAGTSAPTQAAAPVPSSASSAATTAPPVATQPPVPGTAATAGASPATGTAGGGSLAYIAGFNVWLAAPDGSGARQLTSDGNEANAYHDPSQVDDGRIFVLRGTRTLVQLGRDGQAVAPPVSLNVLENGAEGLAVSPNGARLAYATTGFGTEIDPRFGTPAGAFLYGGTDIAAADGTSIPGAAAPTLLFPDWVDDDNLVGSDGVELYTKVAGPGDLQPWLDLGDGCLIDFDCPAGQEAAANISIPAVSAAARVLAYSYRPYFGAAGRRFATLAGLPPAAPTTACMVPGQENFQDAGSFAPDGSAFAFDDSEFDPKELTTRIGEGIHVFTLDLKAPDCGAALARLVLAGGSQPDWGPAAP